jgi:hypothetical protein
MAKVASGELNGGEQQLCLILVSKGLAILQEDNEKQFYLLDQEIQEMLLESLRARGLPLRASAATGT